MHAEHAELAELGHELARETCLLEPLADMRHHAVADERPNGVADIALLIREQIVDCQEVQWPEGSRAVEAATDIGRSLLVTKCWRSYWRTQDRGIWSETILSA